MTIFLFGTSCNGPFRESLPKEKLVTSNKISLGHPKLIKTIGDPRYGNVQCSLQDKNGNLWFGTTENGLYKYDGKSFSQFTVPNGLNGNNIFSILEDKDGKIWIGTQAGVCLYDGKTFATIQIPLRKNLPPNKVRNTHDVFSIMQDKSGKLWFATIDGVYIYDGKSFTEFIINEGASGYYNVEYILEDKAGNFWFGGRGVDGVFRYDGKSLTKIKLKGLGRHNWAWPLLQDKNGNIWFSNWGGAYRYDGNSFISFTEADGLATGVARIIEDKNGNLLFGGAGGIFCYDGKSFTGFTKDGLINRGIWTILEDRTGNLWVGTRETGLYLYDARLPDGQGKTFINYSEYKH